MALKLGVLASGRGSNLQSILDAIAEGTLDADVAAVITNRPKAAALERAARAGVPHEAIDHKAFARREDFDAALVEALRARGAEWIVLAGFMRILTPVFLDAFPNRVVNIHPALIPAFPGVDAQQQALDHGVRVTGCTVHLVDRGVDTGPILSQAVVPVRQDDTRDTLAARLLVREHELLVATLRWIADGRLTLVPGDEGRPRVVIEGVQPLLGVDGV